MYNEIELITHLRQNTGYHVSFMTTAEVTDLGTDLNVPKLYVGHQSIRVIDKENWFENGYSENENDLILITDINYFCKRVFWKETRDKIRKAYQGWSPFPNDSNYSSVTFVGANMKGASSTNVWWSETIGLIFPRIG